VAEIIGGFIALQLDEGVGHAAELQSLQLIERWMVQHLSLLQWK